MRLNNDVWQRLKRTVTISIAPALIAINLSAQTTTVPGARPSKADLVADPQNTAAGDPDQNLQAHEHQMVNGELIVQFKASASDAEVADAMGKAKLHTRKHVHTQAMKEKKQRGVLSAATDLPVEEAIAELKKHPAVDYAEPNWIYTHQTTSNDPYYTAGYLWGAYGDLTSPATPWGSQAAEAWNAGYTGTNSVCVGVIDEGIEFTHADLAPNIWTNPLDPADGVDNDGNGYVDDAHGWNFYDDNNTIFDAAGDHHGTHVAGTIGAKGGNAIGVAGINWNISIISGKFLGAQGGNTIDAIAAIEYFTDLKTRHHVNIVALNNSWGGGGYSQALHDAIIRAAKAGILFVAAAGNGDSAGNGLNNDLVANYPSNYDTRQGTSTESAAAYDAVIAVAAIDNNGARAPFSNYGAKTVHLGAPGVSILSTYPGGRYAYMDGTSMATPHVTGAVALYASTHPNASADQIRAAILGSVKPTPSLSGITTTGGRLDLSTVIGAGVSEGPPATNAPGAPTGLIATAGTQRVNLTWSAVSNATSYVVKRSTARGGPYSAIASGITGTSFADVNNIFVGSTYYYVVAAVNATGTSPDSNEASASPLASVPTAPVAVTAISGKAQVNGNGTVAINWNASAGATSYKVKRGTASAGPFTVVANAVSGTTFTDTVIANGSTYYYVVSAVNSGGESANSLAAGTKPLPPAPANLSAAPASSSQINLSWVDQSADDTGFKVEIWYGSTWLYLGAVGSTTTSVGITGLAPNSTYYFRVRAYNGTGNTGYSNTASARTTF